MAHLPTIHTLVSDLRTANQAVLDLGAHDPALAADVVVNRAGSSTPRSATW